MTELPEPPRRRAPALDWPIEWSRDEKFWREVATRTVAGMLALVFLGAPTLIYLMLAGGLSARVGVPILIGIGMMFFAVGLWWATRSIVRLVESRQLRKVLELDPAVENDPSRAVLKIWVDAWMKSRRADGDPFGEELELAFTPTKELSEATKARMTAISRSSDTASRILGYMALAAVAAGAAAWVGVFNR